MHDETNETSQMTVGYLESIARSPRHDTDSSANILLEPVLDNLAGSDECTEKGPAAHIEPGGQAENDGVDAAILISPLVDSVEQRQPISHRSEAVGATANHDRDRGLVDPQLELGFGTQHLRQQAETGSVNDLDILWSDFDMNAAVLPPPSFENNYPLIFLPLSDYGIFDPDQPMQSTDGGNLLDEDRHDVQPEPGPLSRFGSRLPSLQPEPSPRHAPPTDTEARSRNSNGSAGGRPWHISRDEYHPIVAAIRQHSAALPTDFVFPSRHALCRYVEGFFSGFHSHLPFLHLPTISMVSSSPELVLAIAAVGAQYRFQRVQAHSLYSAARALVERRIREMDGYAAPNPVLKTPSLLSDGNLQSHSPASAADYLTQAASIMTTTPKYAHKEEDTEDGKVETMQAMILLIALGTWNHRSLLKDALSMASQLALLVRECGLSSADNEPSHLTWRQWTRAEAIRRTKIVSYCFLNLHSITYDIPPKLMNSEIYLFGLPSPESQWNASNESEWVTVREREPHAEVSFRDGYASLFTNDPEIASQDHALSSFGHYVMIHCIIQQIFFARQTSPNFGHRTESSLPSETTARIELALRRWQRNWEATKGSSTNPSSPAGPLGFNSTALFRVAYARLYADLGPCRKLETRDPVCIARGFRDAALVECSSNIYSAVLQSAHSLSVPVRIGIEFVARTQTLTWSIVHSLSNLECAFLLSKWLDSIAIGMLAGREVQEDERRLLGIVRSILSETDLDPQIQRVNDEAKQIRCMAAAVVRLWAETFKGAHVFEIMGPIGAGLELYADMLDRQLDM